MILLILIYIMRFEERKVFETGRALVISLTNELKSLKINKGDKILVCKIDDKIVISKDQSPLPFISEREWMNFVFALHKDNKENEWEKVLREYLKHAINKYVKDVSSTLFKIKLR